MADQKEAKQIRARARRILKLAERDEAFRRRVAADPLGALAEQGLAVRAIPDLIRETTGRGGLGEVADIEHGCHDFTCIISECPATCLVTVEPPPPSDELMRQVRGR